METKQIDWSKKRTPKDIKAGDVLEWEVITDPVRGWYRTHRKTVESVEGNNIVTVGGDYIWWNDINKNGSLKVIQANKENGK